MRLIIVQAGKVKDRHLAALRDDYVERFRAFGRLEVVEADPAPGRALWPAAARCKVLLDERGEQYTSVELSRRLDQWTMRHGCTAFAIGAADGHDPATAATADARWSLSPLTLPHQLAHLIVAEQLYRAASILKGRAYHRE